MFNFSKPLQERHLFLNADTGMEGGVGNEPAQQAQVQQNADPVQQAQPQQSNEAPPETQPKTSVLDSVFSGTLVEKKDPVTGQVQKIPQELESFFGHVISTTRKNIENEYKPLVEKLQNESTQFAEIKAEYEKLRESQMTEAERREAMEVKRQAEYDKKINEFRTSAENASKEVEKYKNILKETLVENTIFEAFGDTKLCNPKQTALLFQSEGGARVEEITDSITGQPTGKYRTLVDVQLTNETTGVLETVTGTPSELFKRWISEDRNLHHLQNKLMPGGNSSPGDRVKSKVDFSKMKPEERLSYAYGKGVK